MVVYQLKKKFNRLIKQILLTIEPIYKPISSAEIEALETRLKMKLPLDYFRFLTEHNGGIPEPNKFNIAIDTDKDHVTLFFGLSPGDDYDLIENQRTCRNQIPAGFLCIAEDPGGNQIVLDCSAENAGAVYFMDHEAHTGKNLTKIADSFTAFLESLH